jgi:hypothetical protein
VSYKWNINSGIYVVAVFRAPTADIKLFKLSLSKFTTSIFLILHQPLTLPQILHHTSTVIDTIFIDGSRKDNIFVKPM